MFGGELGWILVASLGNKYYSYDKRPFFRVLSYDSNLNSACCDFVIGIQSLWKENIVISCLSKIPFLT